MKTATSPDSNRAGSNLDGVQVSGGPIREALRQLDPALDGASQQRIRLAISAITEALRPK